MDLFHFPLNRVEETLSLVTMTFYEPNMQLTFIEVYEGLGWGFQQKTYDYFLSLVQIFQQTLLSFAWGGGIVQAFEVLYYPEKFKCKEQDHTG